MANDDTQDNRDSAFSAITLGDLLGRSGLPRLDDNFEDAHTDPFGFVPAQRTASPFVMPRRKDIVRDVPPEAVQPRADRTFTGLLEPYRRPITSTTVALAVGSLAGATIMLGNPTVVPPDPTTPSQAENGQNGDNPPLGLTPAAFPSPLAWAAGLGLPPQAQSRGILPSPRPASEPSGQARSNARPAPVAPADGLTGTLGDILNQPAPSPNSAPTTPHIGDPSSSAKRLTVPSRTGGNASSGQPQALVRPNSAGRHSASDSHPPAGSAMSSLTPKITVKDAAPSANGRRQASAPSGTARTKTATKNPGTAKTSTPSRSAGTRTPTSSTPYSSSKPSAARPSTSTNKRSTSTTTKPSTTGSTNRTPSTRVAGGAPKRSNSAATKQTRGGWVKQNSTRTKNMSGKQPRNRPNSTARKGGSYRNGSGRGD